MKRPFFGDFPPPSRPRAVKGGIRARSRRGAFGRSWWARRWIAVLEGLELGGRLGRGRSYARRGQVLSIAIDKGRVGVMPAFEGRLKPEEIKAVSVYVFSHARM